MAEDDSPLGEPFIIRFDGLDADQHTLELSTLAEALGGLSRIIAASSHFALTQEVSLRKDMQRVRVVAEAPSEKCFLIKAAVQYAHLHPMFGSYEVSAAAGLTVVLVSFIFARAIGRREEMRLLHQSLESAIKQLGSRDQPTIDRLLSTVEKMAENLRPAVKNAVAPIGTSARTLSVGMASVSGGIIVDEADKAAITSPVGLTVDDERSYTVEISELDIQTGACHVAIEGDPPGRRFLAKITDPSVMLPNNAYAVAMTAQTPLVVRAKATVRDGVIERLFISNYEGRPRGEPDYVLKPTPG